MKILLITGSRTGWTYEEFKKLVLERYKPEDISLMVFGCARGVDAFAWRFCIEHEIQCNRFEADWEHIGNKAGIHRNMDMGKHVLEVAVNRCQIEVLAFRTDISKGTTHMIKYSQSLGLDVVIFDKSSFTFE
ncbi:hypothetical protein [Acinetobacter phage vB_AbaP_HB01]|nr:hypothetical protein [Acinetobacter phage vB_AbaP_HB01]